ncbi:MAG: ribonuclease P protein component [Bacteroidales bacterium]
MAKQYTLSKQERIHSKKTIEALFTRGNESFVVYPFRLVYRFEEDPEQDRAAILCSVSKKKFKRANKRNHVKRQVREAYRLNKAPLIQCLEELDKKIAIAFLYLPGSLKDSEDIHRKMEEALSALIQRIQPDEEL